MFNNKTIISAIVLTLGVMQLSQAQAGHGLANRYGDGYNSGHTRAPLVACKRAVSAAYYGTTRGRGLRVAKKLWQRNASNRYGAPYSWYAAKNKRESCRYNRSTASYKCKVIASPCIAGAGQFSQ